MPRIIKTDPTRTKTIRNRFERAVTKRYNSLKRRVNEVIVKLDGFDLTDSAQSPFTNRKQFQFDRTSDKITGFMDWLREAQNDEIFEVVQGRPQAGQTAWTSMYIRSSYNAGVIGATAKLKRAGARISDSFIDNAFNRPIHADRAAIAYTRTFNELEGITAAMDQQISRTVAEGLAQGLNPVSIARNINERIDKIGISRARMLARTEVINAHADATLNMYTEAGIQGVDVEAEWLTAAGACERCLGLEAGAPYSIEEARGMIPVHPNCRCAWAPVVQNGTGILLM